MANVQQLIDLLTQQQALVTQQQQQINALLAAGNGHTANAQTIPALPDIYPFESSDDKSRISDWIQRFKFAIDVVAPSLDAKLKVKALMNKLSEQAFSEYTKYCLPNEVTDFDFDETVKKLEKLFAKPHSIFVDRYECLKASKDDGEDFRQFINRHKRLLKDFNFSKLNEEQFNVLMLLTALKSSNDAALRQRILVKLTADGDSVTYDAVVEDCISYMTTMA